MLTQFERTTKLKEMLKQVNYVFRITQTGRSLRRIRIILELLEEIEFYYKNAKQLFVTFSVNVYDGTLRNSA